MSDDASARTSASHLLSLLSEWNRRREAGLPCEPADVCPDDPSLQRQLAAPIAAIRRVERVQEEFDVPLVSVDRTKNLAGEPTVVADGLASPPGLEVHEEIGKGGMGIVFRAVQVRLNRPVALKMILSGGGADRVETARFVAEAEAMAAVRHPNVVQVFDCGEHDGRPYLTMELLTGGTLKERLPAGGMTAAATAELVEKLARGVHAAHSQGIIHRDLKPGNVLFDADGTPKVTDFGLAKREAVDQTHTNAVLGTPAYMPPEQARGEGKFVGPPADVWSLGVMLYECLTGRRPFAGSNPLEVMDRITNAHPERPSKHAPVPRDLERVCLKCLAKEPADRYRTAEQLADDLKAYREGRPVTARPIPAVVRGWKWVKRNPVPAGFIAAVVVGLAAIALYFREGQRRVVELRRTDLIAKATLASQRGAGREAITAFDEAVASGHDLTDGQRVERARLLLDISDPNGRAYLESIDPSGLTPDLRGQWHLLNGADLIGRDEQRATDELTRALALLPADSGEAHYAEALLQVDAEKALAQLEESIDRNPTALAPRMMDMFIRFMHGRFDEVIARAAQARLLFPDDPQVAMLAFLSHSSRGEKLEANRQAAVMRKQYPGDLVDVIEVVWPAFGQANSERHLGDAKLVDELNAQLAALGPAKLQAAVLKLSDTGSQALMFQRAPRCIQPLARVFGYVAQATFGMLNPLAPQAENGALLSGEQFADLRRVAPLYAEGYVHYLYAGELVARRVNVAEKDRSLSRGQAAPEAAVIAEQYEAAWRAQGYLFDYRRMSLDGAIMFYAQAGVGARGNTDYDLPLTRKCVSLIRERLADPRVNDLPLHRFGPPHFFTRVAVVAEEFGLALTLLERWQREAPDDLSQWLARAEFHVALGNWEDARLCAMRVLEGGSNDGTATKIFNESAAKLRAIGRAGY